MEKNEKEYLGSCEVDSGEDKLGHAGKILCDNKMLVKIAGIDLKAKEAKYHHSWRKLGRQELR